jgi:DNA invertase Pin-like site-specific DNA recombinase
MEAPNQLLMHGRRRAGCHVDALPSWNGASMPSNPHARNLQAASRHHQRIESSGVRVVLVDDASDFALELNLSCRKRVSTICANSKSDDTSNMMIQMLGAFSEYQKALLVGKLRAGLHNYHNQAD